MARSTLTSGVIAFFIESLLFGVFAITYGICGWILLLRDKLLCHSARNIVLFVASTLMFMLTLVVSDSLHEVAFLAWFDVSLAARSS